MPGLHPLASVKRRIPIRSASRKFHEKPQAQPVPQAPDLRRCSDFLNPFPHVGYGGYTKYYKSKQTEFPAIWSLNNMTQAPPPKQPQQAPPKPSPPPSKASATPTSRSKTRNRRLSAIPEATSETVSPAPSSIQLRATSTTSQQTGKTLRRAQRRVLRAPSSSQLSFNTSRNTSSTTLDRSRSTSSSQSAMTSVTNVSSYFERATSYQSHSTTPTTESETTTPIDDRHDAYAAFEAKLTAAASKGHLNHLRPPHRTTRPKYVHDSDESDSEDGFDWRDSRATFYTAKSSLSDL